MKKTLSAIVIAVACMGGLTALQWPHLRSNLQATASEAQDITEAERQVMQTEEALRRDRLQLWQNVPVFGFDNLAANWTFLNFLQYFGNTEERQTIGYAATPDFFDVIIHRDPYFRLSYRFLSSAVTLFAGQPTETVRLLEQGLTHLTPSFPEDSFWLWRYKAVDELLFLGDAEAAIQSLDNAAEWASQSPSEDAENSALRASRTATFLRQNPDSRQVQANSWVMVWANAINENVRQYAEGQIEALGYQVLRDGGSIQIEDQNPPQPPVEEAIDPDETEDSATEQENPSPPQPETDEPTQLEADSPTPGEADTLPPSQEEETASPQP